MQKNSRDTLIKAFRYVSYEELFGEKLCKESSKLKKYLKEKLKDDYNRFFNELKNNIDHQEKLYKNNLEKT